MSETIPPGLAVYCDSHDVIHTSETLSILRRAGARSGLLLIEGVNGHRMPVDVVRRTADALRESEIAPLIFTFPAVDGDLSASRDWYLRMREEIDCLGQLDAEPNGDAHWSEALLDPWLKADRLMSITSTSAEAPRLGKHGRLFFLQLEMQNSVATLSQRLKVYPDAVCVTGVFDQKSDIRTVAEVMADLRACTAQARRTGLHAEWSAHTLTWAKADATRRWVVETWPAPVSV